MPSAAWARSETPAELLRAQLRRLRSLLGTIADLDRAVGAALGGARFPRMVARRYAMIIGGSTLSMGPMGRVHDRIEERDARFIERQHVFFVATAPNGPGGHVNLSPKGLDGTFAVVDPATVAYLDLTGSGAETIAHLRENGRIVLMFCAFEGSPRILRLHGRGDAILPEDPRFPSLLARFTGRPGVRSVILVSLERVSDSCGFGVPVHAYQHERDDLVRWAERKGPEELDRYRHDRNAASIDGLPALP